MSSGGDSVFSQCSSSHHVLSELFKNKVNQPVDPKPSGSLILSIKTEELQNNFL